MRKLARIEKILNVTKHQNADALDILTIQGWRCVARLGEFKEGDKCLYVECDSLVPPIDQFSFLAKGNHLKKSIVEDGKEVEGYRIKTAKLRGQLSQGLALPISSFPSIPADLEPGTDVTGLLGIYKYDPPLPPELAGNAKGLYPGFIPKTDEERIQNLLDWLNIYRGQHFYATSKIDGTSSSFYKSDNEFGVCGHSLEFLESEKNSFWRLARQYNLKDRFPNGYAIQGETAGEGIQSNRIKLKGVDFYVFYVIDIAKGEYLELDDMKVFAKDLGLKTVPVVYEDFILDHTCDDLLTLSDAPSPLNPSLPQEGLVFRLKGNKQKISFKVLSNAYLIKWGL